MNVTSQPQQFWTETPPQHLVSDFVEMGYLLLVIALGTPTNVNILTKLLQELRSTKLDGVKMGFLLLKININISDLLILTILAVGKLCWLATYEWVGGDVLCKLFNFLSMFTLYISSNIVVCIALDRLRTVLGASRVRSGTSNVVRFMIVLSWLLAFIWSLPQLYVWRTIDVFPQHPGGWVQCSDIWSILRFEGWNVSENDIFLGDMARNAYDLSHLVLVFWGPLVVLGISYAFIAVRLLQYSIKAPFNKVELENNSASSERKVKKTLSNHNTQCNGLLSASSHNSASVFSERRCSTDPLYTRSGTGGSQSFCQHDVKDQLLPDSSCVTETTCSHNRSTNSWARNSIAAMAVNAQDLSRKNFRWGLPQRSLERSAPRSDPTELKSTIKKKLLRYSSVFVDKSNQNSWRKHLRNKVFRTTLLVVLTHVIFWFPYNLYALMKYINEDIYEQMSEHANIFKDLQILITLVNPFLYGF